MPFSFACPSCGKKLRAGEAMIGRTLPCPFCQELVQVPPQDLESAAYDVLADPTIPAPPAPPTRVSPERSAPLPRAMLIRPAPSASVDELPPLSSGETPFWLRHLHWLLALAMIPLAFSLLDRDPGSDDISDRLSKTLENAPPEVRERVSHVIERMEDGEGSDDELFRVLPNRKFHGALLPRNTFAHWLFALISVILFLGFCMLLALDGSAQPWHLLAVGLFTATVGIGFLLLVQLLADLTQGVWVRGGGIGTLLFFILKLIGYSYRAALDPENGFILSFIGFTIGVGLCEEAVKLAPVLVRFRQPNDYSWRNAFLWGLASGAGFGIAEGIMYAGRYYNGISGLDIYLVRFLSFVALHALWTGSAAIMLHQLQHLLHSLDNWYEFFVPMFVYVGGPMILHGLYDTLLKKEMNAAALLIAAVSFGFLAVQIYLLRSSDDAAAHTAMLREYRRRRRLMEG